MVLTLAVEPVIKISETQTIDLQMIYHKGIMPELKHHDLEA